jgi:hypothetical protein
MARAPRESPVLQPQQQSGHPHRRLEADLEPGRAVPWELYDLSKDRSERTTWPPRSPSE